MFSMFGQTGPHGKGPTGRVVFVIQTSERDIKSGESGTEVLQWGPRAKPRYRGSGGQSPQKLKHCVTF